METTSATPVEPVEAEVRLSDGAGARAWAWARLDRRRRAEGQRLALFDREPMKWTPELARPARSFEETLA